MARYSFGQVGTWVPVLIVAITTIGWFSIDAYLIGDSAHRLFSWMPTILICILAGIGMTITASKGTKWMNMLSNIAVPIVLIFGFISIIRAFNDVGGVAPASMLLSRKTPSPSRRPLLWASAPTLSAPLCSRPTSCALPRMQRPPSLL